MWKWFGITLLCIVAVYTIYYINNKDGVSVDSRINPKHALHAELSPPKEKIKQTKDSIGKPEISTKIADPDSLKQKSVDTSALADKQKTTKLWPVETPPLLPGSLLPTHRIIAFYGNLYSTRMGILGEFPPDTVLQRLKRKVKEWQAADTSKIAIPALQLITMTGQPAPGRDSLYRQRMPFWMIDSVIKMAHSIDALVILDFQVGMSTVEKEIPYYEKYLKMPQVGLAIDPEFSMKEGHIPGTRIGTLDASDINFCIQYLKGLVEKYHLPPKVLVIHRFTQGMVTNYQDIHLSSEVQVIMDMDGFGAQALKRDSYERYIYKEPVEYTGIKLFFKNDNRGDAEIMTPEDVLKLHPEPLYIQYQ